MPTDPESKRTTNRTERDTHVAEINRLQIQRDALNDLLTLAVSWVRDDEKGRTGCWIADVLVARRNRIMEGK